MDNYLWMGSLFRNLLHLLRHLPCLLLYRSWTKYLPFLTLKKSSNKQSEVGMWRSYTRCWQRVVLIQWQCWNFVMTTRFFFFYSLGVCVFLFTNSVNRLLFTLLVCTKRSKWWNFSFALVWMSIVWIRFVFLLCNRSCHNQLGSGFCVIHLVFFFSIEECNRISVRSNGRKPGNGEVLGGDREGKRQHRLLCILYIFCHLFSWMMEAWSITLRN